MTPVLVLGQDQVRGLLDPDALLRAVADVLVATSRGEASTPPRIAAVTPAGLLGAMPGYVQGFGAAGKLVSVYRDDGAVGRSNHKGLVAYFDEDDGRLLAILDAEALTGARTAASATVAFRALRPPTICRIAVVGAGTQARAQLELLAHLDMDAEVVVASRDPTSAEAAARAYDATAAGSVEEAVRGAEVVFCCTDAAEPVVRHDWLAVGAHVSSVGGSRGRELDPLTVAAGAVFVEWPGASGTSPPAGAHELQDLPPGLARLVGEVLETGWVRPPDQLTVFKSTGYAALDVAAAHVAYAAARAAGVGDWIEL